MGISIRDSSGSDARTGSSTSSDPDKADSLADYANFLRNVRRDYDRAEAMYERAITADPNYAHSISNYAWFLKDVRTGKLEQEGSHRIRQPWISVNVRHKSV